MTGFEEIVAAFSEEPAFVRMLKRKISPEIRQARNLGPGGVRRIRQAVKQDMRLQKAEIIDTIVSPFTADDITGKDDVLQTYPLVPENAAGQRIVPETSLEIAEFRQRLKRNPAFEKGLYAVDEKTGRITDFAVMIRFAGTEQRPEMVDEIQEIAGSYDELDIVISGVPYISRQFNRYMEKDLYRSTPLVLMVVALVFFLNFRSLRGVILPLATLGMAEIWTLGLMGYLGCPLPPLPLPCRRC
ncbi:MAG: MMPL family transporter [Desulfobacterales bacterium]|nr:MMPL family transporter [Desulfobacterales bacterium]